MYPSPEKPVSGIFVHRQVRKLDQLGHNISVISPVPWVPRIPSDWMPEKWRSYRKIPRETKINDIKVKCPRYISLPGSITIPFSSYYYQPAVLNAVNELAASGFDPDVINAHTILPAGFGSQQVANQYDIPLVTTVHGASLQVLPDQFGCMPLLKRTIGNSAHVIVNSTKLERLAQDYFGPSESRSIVPNGIPLDEIDSERDSTPPDAVNTTAPTLISVGNLVRTKGHRYALRALASLPSGLDFEYVLVGDGPEREQLVEETHDLGIDDSVTFVGEVPNREVFKYLWGSDVFVLPSYQEAFGIAYLEAMACELPVIACRGEGPEDFIEHEQTGFLVSPENVDALSDILTTLLSNTGYRNEVGRQARTHIENEFTWTQNAKRVIEILESVV